MTIAIPENKIIPVDVNNYSQRKISYLKESASSENIPSPTSNFVPVFIPGTLLPHHRDTSLLCVSVQRFN